MRISARTACPPQGGSSRRGKINSDPARIALFLVLMLAVSAAMFSLSPLCGTMMAAFYIYGIIGSALQVLARHLPCAD